MSDAQTIWNLSLALGCSVGAWWMKFCSGVSDDDKKSDVRNVVAGRSVLRGIRDRREDRGTNPMKGKNERASYRTEPGSNVIAVDFAHCRAVRDMRKRLHELGVFTSSRNATVK